MEFDFEQLEEIRRRNLEKKWRPCLGWCRRKIFTDITHRFCHRCTERREGIIQVQVVRVIPFADVGIDDVAA